VASYQKHQDFVEQVLKGVHNFSSHTLKMSLHNTAPTVTNTVFANLTEISAGNGYSAGGATLDSVTLSETTGTAKVVVADEVVTASGGTIGPFRYVEFYNDTPTSPADPLICFFDYGSSITLNDTETFTADVDGTNGVFQLV
jgi:hypothetical protein